MQNQNDTVAHGMKRPTVVTNSETRELGGACALTPLSPRLGVGIGGADSVEEVPAASFMSADEITAAQLGITVARLQAMRQYAANLRRQNPKMKEARIRSKVAKQFNIKLT